MSTRVHVRPLVQVARPAVVCRHLGQLALVLAALLAVPAVFAAATADRALAGRLVLAAVIPALALGICSRLPAGQRPLQVNEALAVTALAFLLASALMVYPLMTGGLSPLDAWFEATSGVTTTGLSMVADPQTRSAGFLFARGWAQWFGGLGIVVLSLALAAGRVADMRRLADPAMDEEDLAQGARLHARRVLVLYAALTIGGFLLVWAAGPSPLQALIHTLSAISTGGFSSQADGLAGFSRQAQLALLLVALLGALPLGLIYTAYARGSRGLLHDPEVRALAIAILAVTAGLWLLGRLTPADALLQALSAQTTTGFSTVDIAALDPGAKWVCILSMAAGGGVGSTAGGVKLLRLLVLIRVIQLAVLRAQVPRHAVLSPRLGEHAIDPRQTEHALLLILLFVLVILVSWLPFLVAGYPPLDALFEVVSAVGTVGLSTGITGPQLESGLKLVLGVDMLLGRLEIIALLVLVYPGTWHKR